MTCANSSEEKPRRESSLMMLTTPAGVFTHSDQPS